MGCSETSVFSTRRRRQTASCCGSSISTSFVLSREAMSTASDISSIGTADQIAKSRITCYDLPSRHSHRRRLQRPSEVHIAVKAEQLNQYNDSERREVVQACNSRLITGDGSRHWCMKSEMTDLKLLTPFSSETLHSGFLQDLVNSFQTPAMYTHRPPTPLTASKYSPLHWGRCQIMLKESTVHLSRASCCQQGRRNGYIAKKMVPAIYHWTRTRETQDTSVQRFLMVVHERTYELVLFSLASEHSPLHLRKVVRSQENEEHCVRSRLIHFSGLKGKPQETAPELCHVRLASRRSSITPFPLEMGYFYGGSPCGPWYDLESASSTATWPRPP